jgi:hypothetical protein
MTTMLLRWMSSLWNPDHLNAFCASRTCRNLIYCRLWQMKLSLLYLSNNCTHNLAAGTAQSVRAARSRHRIPVEARLSVPTQTGPEAHPTSCTMGTGSFPRVKRPRRGPDRPFLSSAEGASGFKLYLRLRTVTGQECHGVTFITAPPFPLASSGG